MDKVYLREIRDGFIVKLHKKGYSKADIARIFNLTKMSITYILKKHIFKKYDKP